MSEPAALFILGSSVISLSSTLLFWYTIYYIPVKYGKISMAVYRNRKLKVEVGSMLEPVDLLLIKDLE